MSMTPSELLDYVDTAAGPAQPPSPENGNGPAVKLLMAVWGADFIQDFLEISLPTMLAPGNIPAMAAALPTEAVFLTTTAGQDVFTTHPAFQRLQQICQVRFIAIDDLIVGSNYSTTVTLSFLRAIRSEGDRMLQTYFVFLVSDYLMADNSMLGLLRHIKAGHSGIYAGNFQVVEDAVPQILAVGQRNADGAISILPRMLVRAALDHLHPATIANIVNQPLICNSHTNRLFWRVDADALIGRFFLMHMLCIKPETTEFRIGSSCDYSFIPEMCPSGNIAYITDSDDYFVVEHQRLEHESSFLRAGRHSIQALASSLAEWTTAQHRHNAGIPVIYHAGDIPPQAADITDEGAAFVAQVQALLPPPQPHRGHPYWIGAIEAFRYQLAQIRQQSGRSETGGAPEAGLLRRLYWRVMGRAPLVTRLHHAWLDYQPLMARLAPTVADGETRIAVVTDAPGPLTVWLRGFPDQVDVYRTSALTQKMRVNRKLPDRHRAGLVVLHLDGTNRHLLPAIMDGLPAFAADNAEILLYITAPDRGFDIGQLIARHVTLFFNRRISILGYREARGHLRAQAFQLLHRAARLHAMGRPGRLAALPLIAIANAIAALDNMRAATDPGSLGGLALSAVLHLRLQPGDDSIAGNSPTA